MSVSFQKFLPLRDGGGDLDVIVVRRIAGAIVAARERAASFGIGRARGQLPAKAGVGNEFAEGRQVGGLISLHPIPHLTHRSETGEHEIESHDLGTADRSRSEEHTYELKSLMRISYAVFCLKKKKKPELNAET